MSPVAKSGVLLPPFPNQDTLSDPLTIRSGEAVFGAIKGKFRAVLNGNG